MTNAKIVVDVDGKKITTTQPLNKDGAIEAMAVGGKYKQDYEEAFKKGRTEGAKEWDKITEEFKSKSSSKKIQRLQEKMKKALSWQEVVYPTGVRKLVETTKDILKKPKAKGGSVKKQYGYAGGGKVYSQPRTTNKPKAN